MATTIRPNLTKGFDVMRGSKTLKHFTSYEAANAFMREHKGTYVRYWAEREG